MRGEGGNDAAFPAFCPPVTPRSERFPHAARQSLTAALLEVIND